MHVHPFIVCNRRRWRRRQQQQRRKKKMPTIVGCILDENDCHIHTKTHLYYISFFRMVWAFRTWFFFSFRFFLLAFVSKRKKYSWFMDRGSKKKKEKKSWNGCLNTIQTKREKEKNSCMCVCVRSYTHQFRSEWK